jgi:CBS domain-containing protein
MSIREYARRNPCTGTEEESVREAAKRMDVRGVGCLVVVDAGGRPVGMLTDRDVVLRVLHRRLDPDLTRIGDVMQREVSSVRETDSVERTVRVMRREAVRRVPVVDAEGRLVGIFSSDDALQILASELGNLAGAVRAQFPADLAPEHALRAHGGETRC